MTSTFSNLVRSAVAPVMHRLFGDANSLLTFTDSAGNVTSDIRAIWRAEADELRIDGKGNQMRVRVAQAVISTDPQSHFGHLTAIDLEGSFTKDGIRWDIEAIEGLGVESRGDSFAVVNLLTRYPITQRNAGRSIR